NVHNERGGGRGQRRRGLEPALVHQVQGRAPGEAVGIRRVVDQTQRPRGRGQRRDGLVQRAGAELLVHDVRQLVAEDDVAGPGRRLGQSRVVLGAEAAGLQKQHVEGDDAGAHLRQGVHQVRVNGPGPRPLQLQLAEGRVVDGDDDYVRGRAPLAPQPKPVVKTFQLRARKAVGQENDRRDQRHAQADEQCGAAALCRPSPSTSRNTLPTTWARGENTPGVTSTSARATGVTARSHPSVSGSSPCAQARPKRPSPSPSAKPCAVLVWMTPSAARGVTITWYVRLRTPPAGIGSAADASCQYSVAPPAGSGACTGGAPPDAPAG